MPRDLYQATATNRDLVSGALIPLSGVRVTVNDPGGGLATIFQAPTGAAQGPLPGSGATGGPNPFTTGASGAIEFYANSPDEYEIEIEDTVAPSRISDQSFLWTAASFADNSIPGAKIIDLSIVSGKLADNSIPTAKLADDAVTAAKILAAAVGTPELADNAVTSAKIVNDAVGSTEIAAAAVGSTEIADGAVTAAKIPANVLTLAQMLLGHGVGYSASANGGNKVQTVANSSDILASVNFAPKTTRALIVALGMFKEIRGGTGSFVFTARILSHGSTSDTWDAGGGWGGFSLVGHVETGLTPGATYSAQAVMTIANSPITAQAWGNASVMVFDLAD